MVLSEFNDLHLKTIIMDLDSIENQENGRLEGVNFKFKPIHEDKIYNKTNGKPVGFFPIDLNISLDMKSVIELNALLLETLSSYLFNLRKKISDRDLIEIINSKIDDDKYIKVRVSRYFFREEEKGRYKISIAIIKKGTDGIEDSEIVNISYTKRDIIVLTSVLKRMISSYHRDSATSVIGTFINNETRELVSDKHCMIAKVDNSIVIDQVWLHGQELMNIMYTVQELIYKLNIEDNISILNSFYRQVKFTTENEIVYLELSKMSSNHEYIFSEDEEQECIIRIPFSSYLMSIFHLYLDINILRHADFEDDMDDNTEVLGSTKTYLGKGVKYHISMKESLIGIAINERRKHPDQSKISLIAKVKDGQFSAINELDEYVPDYMKMYKDDVEILVPVLKDIEIDMRDQWPKLIKGLSMAYTQEYRSKRDINTLKFFVINQTPMGRYKFQFKIYSDPNNKAPAVLTIDKIRIKKDGEFFESRYRQPLFKKYIYQLISIILSAAQDVENIDFLVPLSTKDLMQFQFKSFKTVKDVKKGKEVEFGIKKHGEDTLFGNFSTPNTYTKLRFQDTELINISSYFRILNGYWIPFVGDKISIGQDGYMPDIFGEVNLEEEEKGLDWAVKLYFGTSN